MKSIHPFPARMAPDLALEQIMRLQEGSILLDPMAGSGTVLRQAASAGYRAIGFDMDPLAVLMSRVATTPCDVERLDEMATTVADKASALDGRSIRLEWIDSDPETREFVEYWFAPPQRLALRKLAKVFNEDEALKKRPAERNALLLAMSRIIVTKEQRASLARDTSRSRPHRVADTNEFDVFPEFVRSAKRLKNILGDEPPAGLANIQRGDARKMNSVAAGSIDAVITSPPYLNAIDYLRGHKLSLVWMGYSSSDIRKIRSHSVGAERGPDSKEESAIVSSVLGAVGDIGNLPSRHQGMIGRYAHDLNALLKEISRVVKARGQATFVVGNSCLKGVFIRNSSGVAKAAELNGFKLVEETERELPASSRSLPMLDDDENALSKRMRTESVLVFERQVA